MNEIAAKLGEVGLPVPLSELAAKDWDCLLYTSDAADE